MFLTLLLLFVILSSLVLWRRSHRFWQCLNELPQPPNYPIVGNLFDFTQTPEQLFLGERKRSLLYYPIYKIDILGVASANVLNPEDIEIILKDSRQNVKSILYRFLKSWLGEGLLTSGGQKWQNRRKILTPAFHFNVLREFIDVFVKNTLVLVEKLKGESQNPHTDVVPLVTHCTLLSIGETAMGINLDSYHNDRNTYISAVYALGRLLTHRAPRPWIYSDLIYSMTPNAQKEKKLVKIVHTFSYSIISEHQKVSSNYAKPLTMLDLLLKYKSEGANIDDEGIREEVDTFMFEGHDTTSMALCFSLMILANEREAQERIYTEIQEVVGDNLPNYNSLNKLKYMERCIKEILRLYPSVPFISRVSGSEIKTKTGYTIPKNCMINVRIYDLHHNPNVWPDPEKFDPDRFLLENIRKRHPFAYIPFSAGPRNCIGQKFAMLEMKVVLCLILKNFILESVDMPKDIVLISDLVLRPKGGIRVKFVPRSS